MHLPRWASAATCFTCKATKICACRHGGEDFSEQAPAQNELTSARGIALGVQSSRWRS